jgi:[CysO sulfur-carrier protein]-S-L-cysteine hydrolase
MWTLRACCNDFMPLIRKKALTALREHALAEYPSECCGLLSGRGGLIETCVRATNQRASSQEFFIPPQELFAFFRRLRADSEQFLGIYHSHPRSEAIPSPRDVAEFYYPEVSYWIISLLAPAPDIRCFSWGKMGFIEREYRVIAE